MAAPPTPSSMILRALRLTGEKVVGGTLTSDEQTAYFADFLTMLDGWSISPLMLYQLVEESLALTSSQGIYTLASRPIQIVDPCFTRDSSSLDRPVELMDKVSYGRITDKTLEGTYPEYLYYDALAFPLARIYLSPEPGSGLTLYFNAWRSLPSVQAITTPMVLPPGLQRAIEYNLAVELAGGFIRVQPEVAKIARESLADWKRNNAKNSPSGLLQLDPGVYPGGTRFNIYTG